MSESNPMIEGQNFPVHREPFEVVCLKKGISSMSAKTGDFKRIGVMASDPLSAQLDDGVRKSAEGYEMLFAVPPGTVTPPEIAARMRDLQGEQTDRSKI